MIPRIPGVIIYNSIEFWTMGRYLGAHNWCYREVCNGLINICEVFTSTVLLYQSYQSNNILHKVRNSVRCVSSYPMLLFLEQPGISSILKITRSPMQPRKRILAAHHVTSHSCCERQYISCIILHIHLYWPCSSWNLLWKYVSKKGHIRVFKSTFVKTAQQN